MPTRCSSRMPCCGWCARFSSTRGAWARAERCAPRTAARCGPGVSSCPRAAPAARRHPGHGVPPRLGGRARGLEPAGRQPHHLGRQRAVRGGARAPAAAVQLRYGVLELVVAPYFAIVALMAPVVEAVGVLIMIGLLVTGVLDVPLAILFLLLAYGWGTALSLFAIAVDEFAGRSYSGLRDRLLLFGCA